MRKISHFMYDGMIKSRGDFGDCIHNMGTLYFQVMQSRRLGLMQWNDYVYVNKSGWENTVKRLEVTPGQWVRHDQKGNWTNNPQTLSRDAARPILRAAKAMGDMGVIKRFCWAHAKRLWLFMPNVRKNGAYPKGHPEARTTHPYRWKIPDPTGPVFWAFLLRCLDAKWAYPLFYFADLLSVLNAYSTVRKGLNNNKTHRGDIRNFHEHLQFCKLYHNTFLNDWAIKVYSRIDPEAACEEWWSEKRNEVPMHLAMKELTHYVFR